MSGVAACCVFLPFVINMAYPEIAPEPWPKNVYLGTLGVGIGSSFGFMCPFLFTPAYFCHFVGKVPIKKMAKYSVGSAIICILILWLALCHYAPVIWDPNGEGILPVDAPTKGGGGGGGGEEAPPAEEERV
ncbi:uncharacterized protein [Epargyreus clarus]|uniref:uncharacterized protein n=1 Tax=Epargyreus clarus TaxID=520877 RepID=UPI003C2E4823